MEEVQELIIVLHVQEGINLNRTNNPIVVSASLDRNVLETQEASPGNATLFDSNLIWETDRKSMKRMKTGNLPIKIECHSVEQKKRELIGHLIVSLRNIPILPANKASTVKPRWYRLVGLTSDWRLSKPEFLMVVMITDKKFLDGDPKMVFVENPDKNYEESEIICTNPESDMVTSQQGIFIKLLENQGLLQVGNVDTDCDVFLVKILIKNAKYLDELLNEDAPVNQQFHVNYKLLGKPFSSKLDRKMNNLFNIQEKIVINFRTSLKALNDYFTKVFSIPIELFYNDKLVGGTVFKLTTAVPVIELQEFLSKYVTNDNTFETEEHCFIAPPEREFVNKPVFKLKISLKYISTDKKLQIDEFIRNNNGGGDSTSKSSFNELAPTPSSTQLHKSPSNHIKSVKSEVIVSRNQLVMPVIASKSTPAFVPTDKTDIESILRCENKDLRDVPRTFSYNLVLKNAKFNKRPDNGIWQISFQHPKADTPFTKTTLELFSIRTETVCFENAQLQLYFSAMPDNILDTIISDSCKLSIHGPHGVYAFAELDNQNLVIGNKEKQIGVILMENPNGESIAMANIFVYLDEVGINYNSSVKRYESHNINIAPVSRPHLDEQLAYKIVEELEEWKSKQQEIFLLEMKRKERKLLTKLSNEWKKKRDKVEAELAEKLEQCSALTTALEETQRNLKEKGLKRVEQEKIIAETRISLDQCYKNQLMGIKEKARRLEEDLTHQLNLKELENKELKMNNNALSNENEKLREVIIKLEGEIERLKQGHMGKEQAAQLFQDLRLSNERFENAETSRIFYKEQWAKSIREIHKIKSGIIPSLRSKYLGLNDLLATEKCDLASEQDELESVRQLIFNE